MVSQGNSPVYGLDPLHGDNVQLIHRGRICLTRQAHNNPEFLKVQFLLKFNLSTVSLLQAKHPIYVCCSFKGCSEFLLLSMADLSVQTPRQIFWNFYAQNKFSLNINFLVQSISYDILWISVPLNVLIKTFSKFVISYWRPLTDFLVNLHYDKIMKDVGFNSSSLVI